MCGYDMMTTIQEFLSININDPKMTLEEIRLTNFDNETVGIFKGEFTKLYVSPPTPTKETEE